MAPSLKLLICLLLVAFGSQRTVASGSDNSTTTTAATTTPEQTTNTTAGPTTNTSAGPTANTTAGPTANTTAGPTTPGGSTTTGRPTTTPTVPQGSCDPNPCKDGSICQQRVDKTYICLCETGDYYDYDSKRCISAKVFPGDFKTGIDYHINMTKTDSQEFKEAAEIIVTELDDAYRNQDKYQRSIVLKLSEGSTRASKVVASVEIIFALSSTVSPEDVQAALEGLTVTALCPSKPCDVTTTTCEEYQNSVLVVTCPCKDAYVKSPYSDLLCVACPKGTEAVYGHCNPCYFGYSGFNCEDKWLMILLIVGSVLGFLSLIAIIVIPVVVVNSKKKLKKAKRTDYEKPDSNSAPAKTPQRRLDDDEDSNPYSRPMKPQNNPYGGGRPQTNPYASNQGRSNSNYRH